MQRLDLNLASNPFRNNTLLWSAYGSVSVLLVLFSVWNINTFVDYRARLLELRDTVGTFQTQRQELDTRGRRALAGIRRFDVRSLEVKADKANEVIEWKAFSWTRLFNTLERILPYQVRMNSVRPIFNPSGARQDQAEAETGAMPVAIEGTARTFDDLAELQRAFHAEPQIGRVEPERLDKTDSGEYVFHLRFMYIPAEDERNVAEQPSDVDDEAVEVAEVTPETSTETDTPDADAEDDSLPPGADQAIGTDPDPAANANATPVEVDDPGLQGQGEIDRSAVGTPAAKAKRNSGVRSRSESRRKRPMARDENKDKDEDQP